MISGYYGSELPANLPKDTELNCYEIDCAGRAEYHSSGTAAEYSQDPEMLTDDYGYEVADGSTITAQ